MNSCRRFLCHKLSQTARVAMVTSTGSRNSLRRNAYRPSHFIIWHTVILCWLLLKDQYWSIGKHSAEETDSDGEELPQLIHFFLSFFCIQKIKSAGTLIFCLINSMMEYIQGRPVRQCKLTQTNSEWYVCQVGFLFPVVKYLAHSVFIDQDYIPAHWGLQTLILCSLGDNWEESDISVVCEIVFSLSFVDILSWDASVLIRLSSSSNRDGSQGLLIHSTGMMWKWISKIITV